MPVLGKLFDLGRFDLAVLLVAAGPVVAYALWLAGTSLDLSSAPAQTKVVKEAS